METPSSNFQSGKIYMRTPDKLPESCKGDTARIPPRTPTSLSPRLPTKLCLGHARPA